MGVLWDRPQTSSLTILSPWVASSITCHLCLMTAMCLPPVQTWSLNSRFLSSACFPGPLRCVQPKMLKPGSFYSPPVLLLLQLYFAQAKKTWSHSYIFLFLPVLNTSVKAVGSALYVYSKPDQFSLPLPPPLWPKTPFSMTWTIAIES